MSLTRATAGAGSNGEILVIVSIDTEEDNWVPTRDRLTVENIRTLPRLNRLLRHLGVRPTYFINHAVAATPWAAGLLGEMHAAGGVELAAHLHPWNTPPLEPEWSLRDTMLKNLPAQLQHAKLEHLTEVHRNAFGASPTAFRAGRWGMGPEAMRSLVSLGYAVDSSVTPFTDWRTSDDGPNFVGAPLGAYRHDGLGDLRTPVPDGPIVEIPASFAYNRAPFERWHRVHAQLMRALPRRLRLPGVCHRTGLLRKLTLSPETDSVKDMLTLSRVLIEQGVRYVQPFWHSPSSCPGLTPFVHTQRDAARFPASIERYFRGLDAIAPLRFVTISEAADILAPRTAVAAPPGLKHGGPLDTRPSPA